MLKSFPGACFTYKMGIFHDHIEVTILKFIYSKKPTKFCEISTLLLSYVVPVKSKVEISQNFVAFSECMNFTTLYISQICLWLLYL